MSKGLRFVLISLVAIFSIATLVYAQEVKKQVISVRGEVVSSDLEKSTIVVRQIKMRLL